MNDTWLALAWMGSLGGTFFLNGMEAGVQSLSRLRIRQWLRSGRSGARSLLAYLDQPENFLWTILVGNALASFAAICLVVAELQTRLAHRPALFWTALMATGGVLFVVTDLLPKTLFRRYPNRLCLTFVGLFRLVHFALSPLVRLVEHFAALMLRFTRGKAQTGRLFGNRDELRALLQESGGALIPGERALINRVLDAQNIMIARIATPLADLPRLTTDSPVEQFLTAAREHSWDRLPIWDTHPSQARIRGVLTLHRVLSGPAETTVRCGDLLAPAVFLDDSLRLDDALRRLQRGGSQTGVVLGPDGRERAFITVDQLLQALFGEVVA